MAFSASVPIVFWGSKPLSHEINCICMCDGPNTFATGSKSGHICVWKVEYESDHHPKVSVAGFLVNIPVDRIGGIR